jgi:hypothetical protein
MKIPKDAKYTLIAFALFMTITGYLIFHKPKEDK